MPKTLGKFYFNLFLLNTFRILNFLEIDVETLELEWNLFGSVYQVFVKEAFNGILALKKMVPKKVQMLLFTGEN